MCKPPSLGNRSLLYSFHEGILQEKDDSSQCHSFGGLLCTGGMSYRRLLGRTGVDRREACTDRRSSRSKVVRKINQLSPDCACFTGDIVEDIQYLGEALELLSGVCCPMFGVPGNWEYLSGATFSDIAACFESTGGAWLVDEEVTTGKGQISIFGATANRPGIARTEVDKKRLLLTHYPASADELEGQRFDLILAGHSGGQARIPFIGALILPDRVGEYERGLYETGAGPLYVNPGIGTWYLPVRFCCRPEITLVEF